MITVILDPMPDGFAEKLKQFHLTKFFGIPSHIINADVEILIVRTKTIVSTSLMDNYPNLKCIIRAGSGFDNIDCIAAAKRNILVCNTPLANASAAAEHTISMILSLVKQLPLSKNKVLSGQWKCSLEYNTEIADIKALVVGVGRVGSKVGKMLQLLGAEVKGVDPYLSDSGFELVDFHDGLKWCNLITFHCPMYKETVSYFNLETLNSIKHPVWLINCARGLIVSEKAISKGLGSGKLRGVGLDVFENEPWSPAAFASLDNVILSPHSGSYTTRAKERLIDETIEVWQAFVRTGTVSSEADLRFSQTE